MRRSPFVVGGTIAGMLGVIMFHTSPMPLSFAVGTTTTSATPPSTPPSPTTSAPPPTTSTPPRSTPTTAAGAASGTRSATGPLLNYYFGQLSVTVTATGSKITSVKVGSLSDSDFRSQSIDQYAIPILEQEARAAQSANIQSISGASYTSAGFAQSLQGALTKLGI